MHIIPVSLKNYSLHNFLDRSKDIARANYLWGHFPGGKIRGQLSGGQLPSGAIILEGNFPGGNHPGGNYPGGNFPRGSIVLEPKKSHESQKVFYLKSYYQCCQFCHFYYFVEL